MKTHKLNLLKLNILIGPLLLAVQCQAQSYSIDWFTIGGGGGALNSAGGTFTASGTIGQPNAGVMSGGNFTLAGGFWPGVESSPGCLLTGIGIERLGNGRVRVSWPLPGCGYVLYHSTSLENWTTLPPPYETNATHLSVIRSERAEFFTLRRQ